MALDIPRRLGGGRGGVEFVQVGEDDNVALHALELEDGGGPEAALLVLLRGIVRHGLDTTELGGNGAGLLPCLAHTQDDNILSEMRGQNMLPHDDVMQLESRPGGYGALTTAGPGIPEVSMSVRQMKGRI